MRHKTPHKTELEWMKEVSHWANKSFKHRIRCERLIASYEDLLDAYQQLCRTGRQVYKQTEIEEITDEVLTIKKELKE